MARPLRLSIETIRTIIEQYQSGLKDAPALARELGLNCDAVYAVLERNQIRIRTAKEAKRRDWLLKRASQETSLDKLPQNLNFRWVRGLTREQRKRERREVVRRRDLAYKLACIRAYSRNAEGRCVCCGEWRHQFLTLDHVEGGGTKHCEQLKVGGSSLYYYLCTRGFPQDPPLQVLCYNCNCGRWVNRGLCPHERENARAEAQVL